VTAAFELDIDDVAVALAVRGDKTVNLTRDEMRAAWQILEARQLSARVIAETLGVTDRQVTRWRSGKHLPIARRVTPPLAVAPEPPAPKRAPGPWTPPTFEARTITLSPRVAQILDGICIGQTDAQIAADHYLTIDSVKTYVKRLYRYMGARNRAHAAALVCTGAVTIEVRAL